jgi:hypothetical protein
MKSGLPPSGDPGIAVRQDLPGFTERLEKAGDLRRDATDKGSGAVAVWARMFPAAPSHAPGVT